MVSEPQAPTPQNDDSFLDIFRKHHAVMLLIEPNSGRILDANPAAQRFYGYPLARLLEMDMAEINPLPFEQVQADVIRFSADEGRHPLVFPHKLASGEIRTVEVQVSPIILNGRLVTFSIVHDVTGRQNAEDALAASEAELRGLLASMRDVVLVIDRDGVYREIAPTNPDLLYKPSAELLGRNLREVFPLEQAQHFINTVQGVVDTKQSAEIEYSLLIEDRTLWFETTISSLDDDRTLWVARNVTERRRMEDALRESEERYRSLFDNMMDGIYRSTHNGRFVDVNPAMVRMFGYSSREEMLQVDIKKELYFSPEERGSHILDTGQRQTEIYRMRRKDGSEIWVEDHGHYVHDEHGNVIYHEGLLRDVTERIKSEQALRESENSLKEAQTIAGLGSYVLDFSSGMWKSSNMLDQLFGIDEIFDRSIDGWAALIHPDHREDMVRYFMEEVAGRRNRFDKEYKIIRQNDKAERWVHGKGELEQDSGGNLLRMKGTIQDITERRQMEDFLRQRLFELETLYKTSGALSEEMELDALHKLIVEMSRRLLNSSSSSLYLFDLASDELVLADKLELAMDAHPDNAGGAHLKLGEGAAGNAAQTRKPLRITDYSSWEGRMPEYEGIGLRAVMEAPMLYGGELIGIIMVNETGDSKRTYTEADERLLSLFASQAAAAIHSTRLRQAALNRLEHLQSLRAIDKAIASSLDPNITLNILLDHVIERQGADAADVLQFHPLNQALRYVAGRGFVTDLIEGANVHLNDGYAGRSIMGRCMVEIPDPSMVVENPPFAHLWAAENFKSYICTPLIVKGEIKGVMEIYFRSKFKPTGEWLEFLETLAGQAAITIDNAQMHDNLQRANMELAIAYEATIEGWARALDFRSKDVEGYTRRVTDMTLMLAKAMGVNDRELQHIRRGALLHDIGKMSMPDRLLFKKGKLTEQEEQEMRRHPELAHQLLHPIRYLRPALDIPYCHHEKWDGSGYPRGLKGEQIPLAARIFALADTWDSLVSPRLRRKAWTKKKALTYIAGLSGEHFDPKVVEAFLKLMKDS